MSQVVYLTVEPETVDRTKKQSWIHPHLIESVDPVKGRQFRACHHIPKGACLLIDLPYAVIPVVDEPEVNDHLICNNPACNRRAPREKGRYSCLNACMQDVVWCSSTCRDADKSRHGFECTWLKKYAESIRSKRGEYDFGMLWLIVRLLAFRHVELQKNAPTGSKSLPKHSWEAIDSLCGSSGTWSHDQVKVWTTLAKKYLKNSPALPHGLNTDRMLHLICQEEANSFGLYPRETGHYPPPNPPIDRGEQFAAAVYPTAAIANHSCVPNIIHKPDDEGRMVFTASRDIFPGQECCISYFDLTKHIELDSRRAHLRKSFRFLCRCDRCVSEEPTEEASEWSAMPLMDDSI
ncbi:hypothetical protein N7448_000193 [Penicillium atrosanguineum]|uniref:Uncharacterized protein n=1 Tax=Penicillium atrosanguineum TaxID=1132637 RepID=A0A9W9HGG0_9EURO|nr:uncharacterized protein N7443_003593 [Penicillium atrosanguineum]KAJ5134786.1 hypothetical protein N7526_006151 [Penicillium atrosanguineum]KAJ5148615.1 hypothetical protein N7448_000193 [Penicillium atrosanguineum]KAJ5303933.1 hypothetical protein N7443_003593 [Penicillium atrosanguineum]KAJ5323409.1 hypothetical protein N7476_002009 [Penicillium atrosanguineum]